MFPVKLLAQWLTYGNGEYKNTAGRASILTHPTVHTVHPTTPTTYRP